MARTWPPAPAPARSAPSPSRASPSPTPSSTTTVIPPASTASTSAADGFFAAGTNTINLAAPANGLASGDYVIIDYTGGNPDISKFQLGPAPSGYTLSLRHDIDNTNFILHVVSSAPPNPQWNVDSNGSWGLAGNWQGAPP